jgi:hypothetical protein
LIARRFLIFILFTALSSSLHASDGESVSAPCVDKQIRLALGEKIDKNTVSIARIQDQNGAPTCMACSATGSLENTILAHTGEKIPLSTPYLITHAAEIRLRQLYQQSKLTGFPGYAQLRIVDQDFIFKAARQYGIVPESAWKPKVDIHDWDDRVMNLKLSVNYLSESIKNKKMNPEQILDDFHKRVLENTGPFPTSFTYEGKTYTPQQFAAEKLPPLKVEQVQVQGKEDLNEGMADHAESSSTKPLDQVVDIATSQVDKGISVPAVFSYNGMYRKGDVMSVTGKARAFNPRKIIKRDFRHGMVIIGYQRDAAGKVEWLIVQDSRGEQPGDGGILRIHRSYFEPFLRRIQVLNVTSG